MSWDAPATSARPDPTLPNHTTPTLPERATSTIQGQTVATPLDQAMPTLPEQALPSRIGPSIDVLGDISPITPISPDSENDRTGGPELLTKAPKWKNRNKSRTRRLISALVAVLVMVALGAGAWFGYQTFSTTEEAPPTVPLRDRPDTIFGTTGDLVDDINERMPGEELLEDVLGQTDD